MTIIIQLKRVLSMSAAVLVTSFATHAANAQTMSRGLSPNDDMYAAANSTRLMPNAPLGSLTEVRASDAAAREAAARRVGALARPG